MQDPWNYFREMLLVILLFFSVYVKGIIDPPPTRIQSGCICSSENTISASSHVPHVSATRGMTLACVCHVTARMCGKFHVTWTHRASPAASLHLPLESLRTPTCSKWPTWWTLVIIPCNDLCSVLTNHRTTVTFCVCVASTEQFTMGRGPAAPIIILLCSVCIASNQSQLSWAAMVPLLNSVGDNR